MSYYIERRALTHEQVWQIREEKRRGLLNATKWARELGVSVNTVLRRMQITSSYPEFKLQKHARIRDEFQRSYCDDTGD